MLSPSGSDLDPGKRTAPLAQNPPVTPQLYWHEMLAGFVVEYLAFFLSASSATAPASLVACKVGVGGCKSAIVIFIPNSQTV